jgi:hypothetical protein
MKIPSIAAAFALVTACAVQTPAEVHTAAYVPGEYVKGEAGAPAPLAECRIRETRTANGLLLEAVVEADHAVYGEYEFTVTAKGSGGSSDVSQGGAVDLVPGKRATVGSAEFSGGRYRALLTLRDADGALCAAERLS